MFTERSRRLSKIMGLVYLGLTVSFLPCMAARCRSGLGAAASAEYRVAGSMRPVRCQYVDRGGYR